ILQKVALSEGTRPIDGHSPGLSGRDLYAYLLTGVGTDHECNTLSEAKEKLEAGMRIMIREGSTAKNLSVLASLVTPVNERRCLLVSDDRRPGDLWSEGHLDWILRRAVEEKIDPILAIRMVTINVAETFGLNDRGAIKPGWWADLVLFESLKEFKVLAVWKRGRLVAEENLPSFTTAPTAVPLENSISIPPMNGEIFEVRDIGKPVRVIEIVADRIWTRQRVMKLDSVGGQLCASPEKDVAKLVVIERHQGSGRLAIGFVRGLGLNRGALGSTVAHDSHNVIIAGMDDISIKTALEAILEAKGGLVATDHHQILGRMALPIAGLMSDDEISKVVAQEEHLLRVAHQLGSPLSDPFMTLSFLALPVIPELKLSDRGLVDATKLQLVSLYVEERPEYGGAEVPFIG
ncbi:MAG: adenine deaminase C-terminal domain-containing protein, partial [bacterium]